MLLANINNCREEQAGEKETAFDRRLKNATAARSLTIKLSGSSEKGDADDGRTSKTETRNAQIRP
jgi:hypothetical protein